MKRKVLTVLLIFTVVNKIVAQIKDVVIGDTVNVGVFKNRDDSTDIGYYNKKFDKTITIYRIYFDANKTRLAQKLVRDNVDRIDTLLEWFPDGKVARTFYGKKNGNPDLFENKHYFRNGQIKDIRTCNSDTCVSISYYKNGNMKAKFYQKGIRLYYEEKYYQNGQKMSDPHFIEDNKKAYEVHYYESGKVLQKRCWLNYALIEEFKEFHENGKLKISGQYETEEQYFKLMKNGYRDSMKMGKWSYYNISGKLEREEYYDNDVIMKTVQY
jgi:antitoxin component YwqK of YwqJK toxin-antitoxin module